MAIRGILFDKDGTLLDFEPTFAPACSAVLLELADDDAAKLSRLEEISQFRVSDGSFSQGSVLIAGSLRDISDAWETVLNTGDADALEARVDQLFIRFTTETATPFDGTAEILGTLQMRGIELGVATNDSVEAARMHLDATELTGFFPFVAGFDSGFGTKPEPGMIAAFVDHIGCDISEVLMVGDSDRDLQAAKNAGVVGIGVATGMTDRRVLEQLTPYVLDGIWQLPDFLASTEAFRK
ncbi:MAG: HAD family hydrolase [Pseudomonadota bacterium]